jgi:DNA N-6-adenine-methyltransferase (Dam)
VLQRPLRDVPRVIQNLKAGRAPDYEPDVEDSTRQPSKDALRGRAVKLVQETSQLTDRDRAELLLAIVEVIAGAAKTLPGKKATAFRKKVKTLLAPNSMGIGRTTKSNDFGTPDWLIEQVRTFAGRNDPAQGIDLDPASSSTRNEVIGAKRIFTEADDGLKKEWKANFVWCNPPFGKIGKASSTWTWLKKAVEEREAGQFSEAIVLVPYRAGRKWWNEVVVPLPRVDLRELVHFGGGEHHAPFSTSLVYLGDDEKGFFEHFHPIASRVPAEPRDSDSDTRTTEEPQLLAA